MIFEDDPREGKPYFDRDMKPDWNEIERLARAWIERSKTHPGQHPIGWPLMRIAYPEMVLAMCEERKAMLNTIAQLQGARTQSQTQGNAANATYTQDEKDS